MAWTEITRLKYQRDGLRYASDTTDKERALIEPHLPRPGDFVAGTRHGCRPTSGNPYRNAHSPLELPRFAVQVPR